MTPRDFHIGDLLSVSTDRLLSPDRIGGVYSILNHMTGESLMTHQLPMAGEIAKPYLLDQHPWLAAVPENPPIGGMPDLMAWLAVVAAAFGERHSVDAMPPMAWGTHDPIADLQEMIGDKPIIVVSPSEADPAP